MSQGEASISVTSNAETKMQTETGQAPVQTSENTLGILPAASSDELQHQLFAARRNVIRRTVELDDARRLGMAQRHISGLAHEIRRQEKHVSALRDDLLRAVQAGR